MLSILLVLVISLAPFMWLVLSTLKPAREMFTFPPTYLPHVFTLENYFNLLSKTDFPIWFKNSLIVSTATTVIAIAVCILGAYGASRFRFSGRNLFLFMLFLTQMFPGVLLVIPYIEIMRSFGLIDTLASLIITYCTFAIPLCSWILKGYFDSLPRDLEEAAMVDGCSKLGALRRVVLPLSVPGVAATAIFIFIQSWGEAMFAILLTNTSSNYVLAIGIYTLSVSEFEWSWANLLSSGVVTALPLVFIFVFLQKYLVVGLTKGAIKG